MGGWWAVSRENNWQAAQHREFTPQSSWVGNAVCVPRGRGRAPCATCPTPGNQTTAWKQGKKQIFPLTLAQPQSCSCLAVRGGAVVMQELVDASSEQGKSEYFSRWEMVERTWWLFICFLVLWGGFSYLWKFRRRGIRWFKHVLKDAISALKVAAWFKDEAWQVRRKVVEDDQGKWWGQNVELHMGPSWWKSSCCLQWAWVRSHTAGKKSGSCHSEQCYF